MTSEHEWEDVLSRAIENNLDESGQLRLAELLRNNPEARNAYVDHLVLDAMLSWERPAAGPVRQSSTRRVWLSRAMWVTAASLLIGIAGWALLTPTRDAMAGGEIVDQLVEWNLEIVDAETPAARQDLFRAKDEAFRKKLAKAKLTEAERTLATRLHDGATALATEDREIDFVEQVEIVTDQVHDWMLTHSTPGPGDKIDQHYQKLTDRVEKLIQRESNRADNDKAKKNRLERMNEKVKKRAATHSAKFGKKNKKNDR